MFCTAVSFFIWFPDQCLFKFQNRLSAEINCFSDRLTVPMKQFEIAKKEDLSAKSRVHKNFDDLSNLTFFPQLVPHYENDMLGIYYE